MKRLLKKIHNLSRRMPVVTFAIILAIGMVGTSVYFANKTQKATTLGSFDTTTVLPPTPVSMPTPSRAFSAETIKQFNGQDGQPCYVAVNGTVYEIKDNNYWKTGEHTPSGGRGYCGADMSNVISQSPHGESVLGGLPKVGTYQ